MLLLLAAVPLETALIRSRLADHIQEISCTALTQKKQLPPAPVMLAHTGIGLVNMAMQLTRILVTYQPDAVLLFGCGGAYPQSGLAIGDIVIATEEISGDTGVAVKDGFIPCEQLNIPQQPDLAPAFQQSYKLSPELRKRALKILPDTCHGPFVTVNTCSGYPELSEDLVSRTEGLCENMEGFAAARVCHQFDIPLLELRGISNPTGTRDPQLWDIKKGTEEAQLSIVKLLENSF